MCSRSTCSSCSKVDECGWCDTSNAVAVGECIAVSEAATCSASLVTDGAQCPTVGGDVILRNISGMLGAMIGLAIIFNVYNRVSNRRRRNKLRHSIFELPVYVYTASTRKRAKAARLARLQAQGEEAGGSSDRTQSAEVGGSAPVASASISTHSGSSSSSSSSSEDGDEASVATCTVCLAAYEEEEVIKVLPCGHEFHSSCLGSWLEQKATCPLCTAPAFTKLRDQDRHPHGQASIQGLRQAHSDPDADAAPPLFTSPDQAQGSRLGSASSGGGVGGGLLLARPASPPPPPEANGEAGVGASLPSSEARPGEALETARGDEEGATAVPATATATATAMVVEEGEAGGARKDEAVSEEPAAATRRAEGVGRPPTSGAGSSAPTGSAVAGADSARVGAGEEGASGAAGVGVAGDGGGVGPAGVTRPSGVCLSSPCHGGGIATGRGARELSLTELEKGLAVPAPAEAGTVAGAAEEGAVGDAVGVVAEGGLAVGHDDESSVAAAPPGGVDIEGGRSGVDAKVHGISVAFQA